MLAKNVRVGTMGFGYTDWLGNFYPQFCPRADFLRYYAFKFKSVELDNTFYRIPDPGTVDRWREATPGDFVFAAKFPRTVTHEGELNSRVEAAGRFVEVIQRLGPKLGPLLLQFPYSFKPDQETLFYRLLESIPDTARVAVEMRNKKWLTPAFPAELKARRRALCLVDHPWVPRLSEQTADFVYIRLLGDRKQIESDFSYVRFDRTEQLGAWRDVVSDFSASGTPVYAYVNNHYSGHAPTTAARLIALLSESRQA
jgi:uncharacterized protein YecE (DUF72 family)